MRNYLPRRLRFQFLIPEEATCNDSFWNDASTNLLVALILGHLEDCLKLDENK